EPGHDPTHGHAADPKESPWVVTVPLVLLAIPSVYSGWAYVDQVLFGSYFGESIAIAQQHGGLSTMTEEWHGPWAFVVHGLAALSARARRYHPCFDYQYAYAMVCCIVLFLFWWLTLRVI